MKYSRAQIWIHWATALLVLAMAAGGLAYSYDLIGSDILRGHQIGGQLLIVLLVARIVLRIKHRNVEHAHAATHAVWERWLASGVHIALYICLIAFAFTGYVSASALSNNMLLFPLDLNWARSDTGEMLLEWHYRLKWVLLVLFGLHFAGAMKHHLIDRDDTLSNMTVPRK